MIGLGLLQAPVDLNNKQHHKSPLFHMLQTYPPFDSAGHILLPLLSPYILVEITEAIWTMILNDRTDRMGDQVELVQFLTLKVC
jgi:hypothetical protein